MNEQELAAVNPDVILTDTKYTQLCNWAQRNYRDQLGAKDFADPALLSESYQALDELTQLLNLGSVYDFQLEG